MKFIMTYILGGIIHFVKATGYSLAGFKAALKETAIRQEVLLGIIHCPLAFWVDMSGSMRIYLLAVYGLVLITEILNTAIEATVDLACKERNPLAKKAKDCGSAAVFVALFLLTVGWTYVILKRWVF